MITNEREYRIARSDLRRFEEELSKPRVVAAQPGVHPDFVAATPAILNQQLEELRAEIREYEELRSGIHRSWEFSDLRSLPQVLIESRIARGLTQRELANELKVREQAIQRYEDNRYGGASFERIVDVADALGLYIHVVASFDPQVTRIAPATDFITLSSLDVAWPTLSAFAPISPGSTGVWSGISSSVKPLYQGLGTWPSTSLFNLASQATTYPFGRTHREAASFSQAKGASSNEWLAWPFEPTQELPDLQAGGTVAQ
jgi:transcriptional regulator with XRE-family HTH domain